MASIPTTFEWDPEKDQVNREKHGVPFPLAQLAFFDPNRVILEDTVHCGGENRYYCLGKVAEGILTVRFTCRGGVIRIFGAGYWPKGKKLYEQENPLHRRTDG